MKEVKVNYLNGSVGYVRNVLSEINCITFCHQVFIRGGNEEFNEVESHRTLYVYLESENYD